MSVPPQVTSSIHSKQKNKLKSLEQSSYTNNQSDESYTYSQLLGKRTNKTLKSDKKNQSEKSFDDDDNDSENFEKREKRLLQNRKSAKKCRQKKKAQFNVLQSDVMKFQDENKHLKDKISEMTMMLYTKMEENSQLQRKLEQAQLQQTLIINSIMASSLNSNQNIQQNGNYLHSPILSNAQTSQNNGNHQNLLLSAMGAGLGNLSNSNSSQNQNLLQLLVSMCNSEQKKQSLPQNHTMPNADHNLFQLSALNHTALTQNSTPCSKNQQIKNDSSAQTNLSSHQNTSSFSQISSPTLGLKAQEEFASTNYSMDMMNLLKQICMRKSSEESQSPNTSSILSGCNNSNTSQGSTSLIKGK